MRARTLGGIDETVKENLMVKYPPEIKEMLRAQANKFFESQRNKE